MATCTPTSAARRLPTETARCRRTLLQSSPHHERSSRLSRVAGARMMPRDSISWSNRKLRVIGVATPIAVPAHKAGLRKSESLNIDSRHAVSVVLTGFGR